MQKNAEQRKVSVQQKNQLSEYSLRTEIRLSFLMIFAQKAVPKRKVSRRETIICTEQLIKAAENQKILKQAVQNINADGVFPEPTKEGFLFRAKDKQTKEHQHNRRHPEDTDERRKGKQPAFQL